MTGPLSGIRVVDFTTMVSGPVATMMLADQGAEVIKVEAPAGETMRHMGKKIRGMPAGFLCANRNKKSLSVDLKSEIGLEIVRKLIPSADVLVQNFRPQTAERIGLGESAVRKLRPDIVYVSISGFGENGPYSEQRVYDPIIQALSGLADIQADRESREPRMVRTVIPDKTTSVTAAQAITAALFARERSSEGQSVKLAMLDTMVAYLWPEGSSALTYVGDEIDPSAGQLSLDLVFKTKDRFITAGAVSDKEWVGMCKVFGREELITDERFATAEARTRNIVERREIMTKEISKWSSESLLQSLRSADVPCAPILNRKEVLDDPQVAANEIFEIHEDEKLGKVRQPRPAARFSRTPAKINRLAPFLGEHSIEILRGLGYSDSEINTLSSEGVIFKYSN